MLHHQNRAAEHRPAVSLSPKDTALPITAAPKAQAPHATPAVAPAARLFSSAYPTGRALTDIFGNTAGVASCSICSIH